MKRDGTTVQVLCVPSHADPSGGHEAALRISGRACRSPHTGPEAGALVVSHCRGRPFFSHENHHVLRKRGSAELPLIFDANARSILLCIDFTKLRLKPSFGSMH